MEDAHESLRAALVEPPRDLRAWIWSLAPLGKRVLVAAAAAVMTPALEGWHATLARAPKFAAAVRPDTALAHARDAVHEWLRSSGTAQLEAVAPALTAFSNRLDFVYSEVGGDGRLHERAWILASCILHAVRAARWTEDDARRQAAGDAAEESSRLAAGPAYDAAEAVHHYARLACDTSIVQRIVHECLAAPK